MPPKRKIKQSHAKGSKKRKKEKIKTVKSKLKKSKTMIRMYVEVYQKIRVQVLMFIHWCLDERLVILDDVSQDFISRSYKAFFHGYVPKAYKFVGSVGKSRKEELQAATEEELPIVIERWEAYERKAQAEITGVFDLVDRFERQFGPLKRQNIEYLDVDIIVYQARQLLTCINEFYALDNQGTLKSSCRKVDRKLWGLMYQQYKTRKDDNGNEYRMDTCKLDDTYLDKLEQQFGCDRMDQLNSAFELMFTGVEVKVNGKVKMKQRMQDRVEFLKILQQMYEGRVQLCPKASWIPSHLYFKVDDIEYTEDMKGTSVKKRLVKNGFKNNFFSDGYSYCE